MESNFVGREKELESALGVYSQTIAGHGSLLLISGQAGIGKTRYVEEIKRMAERTGCMTITGHCSSGARIPYSPFIEAFSSKIDGNPFAVNNGMQNSSSFVPPQELLFPILGAISNAASVQPLLMHIEDLQWADTPTIELLNLVARTIGGFKIFIIGTYRAEDLETRLNIENTFFLETISRMKQAGLILEIALGPLPPKDLKRIAHSIIDSDLEYRSVRELNKFAKGNPLFFIEMVRFLSAKKQFHRVGDHLELINGYKKEIPPSIIGFELQKYNTLMPSQKRIIDYASVMGEWVDLDLLSEAFDLEKPGLLDVLTSLSNNHLFFIKTGERFHFEHRVAQLSVYQNILPGSRSDMHRKLAQTIESMENRNPPYPTLSDHYYFAGNREKTMEFSISAGETFLKGPASDDALIYLKRAESLLENTNDVHLRIRVFEDLGDVYYEMDREEKADDYYEMCLPMISENSSDRARLLWKRAQCWYPLSLGKGDRSEFMRFIEEAERCPGLLILDHAEIEALHGFLDFLDFNYDEAKLHYIEAIRIFKNHGTLDRLFESEGELLEIYLSEGDPSKSLALLEEQNSQILGDGRKIMEMKIRFSRGVIFWHMGKLEEALNELSSSLEISTKVYSHHFIILANQYSSLIYIELGDFQNAEMCLNNCLDNLDFVNIKTLHSRTLAILAHLKLMQNQNNDAKKLLAESIEEIEDYSSPLNITSGIVKLVEAELLLSLGHRNISQTQFNIAIGLLHKSVYGIMFEAIGFSWYAEILKKNGHDKEAEGYLKKAYNNFNRLGNIRTLKAGLKSNN